MDGQFHDLAALFSAKSTDTHWIRGWVGLSGNQDILEKRKIFCHCWISNRESPRP